MITINIQTNSRFVPAVLVKAIFTSIPFFTLSLHMLSLRWHEFHWDPAYVIQETEWNLQLPSCLIVISLLSELLLITMICSRFVPVVVLKVIFVSILFFAHSLRMLAVWAPAYVIKPSRRHHGIFHLLPCFIDFLSS